MVYDADERFIKAGMVWNGGRRFEAFKELNNTPTGLGAATGVLPAAFPSTWYLRLQSNGTTIQPAYSADGLTWTNYGTTTNLSGLTAPKIGVYATSASSVNRDLRVDWFKLATPQDPVDEFDGSTLNLCRWTNIVRHEPGGYSVGDGKLTLPAAHGDFFAAAPNNNPNVLLQPAPAGPWTMSTKLTFNPNETYEQAGLLVYGRVEALLNSSRTRMRPLGLTIRNGRHFKMPRARTSTMRHGSRCCADLFAEPRPGCS